MGTQSGHDTGHFPGDRFGSRGDWVRHDRPVYHPAPNGDCRRDSQVRSKATKQNGLPADEGAERDAEKEAAVVPGQYRRTLSREVVGETGLLSREEQLRYPQTSARRQS